MRNIILTNIAMEPIGRINWEKAAIMLTTGTAQNLVSSDIVKTVHSQNVTLNVHKVVYLPKYIYKSWSIRTLDSLAPKKAILARDGYKCAYCLEYGDTVDHILPKSRGGDSSYGNLVTCCKTCNNKKSDKTPEEAGMELLYNPQVYEPFENDINEIKEILEKDLSVV